MLSLFVLTMPEPSLTDIFGANALQTGTSLTIDKEDLITVGLIPSATNTAESLLVAILLKAKMVLTAEDLEANPDQSVVIAPADFNFQTLVQRNNITYRQATYSINLQKPDAGATVNPNDY